MISRELAIPERVIEGKVLGVPFSADGCESLRPDGFLCGCVKWGTAAQVAQWRQAYETIGQMYGYQGD